MSSVYSPRRPSKSRTRSPAVRRARGRGRGRQVSSTRRRRSRSRRPRRRKRTKRGAKNVSKLRRMVLLRQGKLAGLIKKSSSSPLARAVNLLLAENRDAEDDDFEGDGAADTPSTAGGLGSLLLRLARQNSKPLLNTQPGSPGSFSTPKPAIPTIAEGRFKAGGLSRFRGAVRKVGMVGKFRRSRGRGRGRGRGRKARKRKVGNRMARLRAAAQFTGRLARLRVKGGLTSLPYRLTRSSSRSSINSHRSRGSTATRGRRKKGTPRGRSLAARRGRSKLRKVTSAIGIAARLKLAAERRGRLRAKVQRRKARRQQLARGDTEAAHRARQGHGDSSGESSCSTDCSCTTVWISEDEDAHPEWLDNQSERVNRVLGAANQLATARARLDGLVTMQRSFVRAGQKGSEKESEELVRLVEAATEAVIKAENLKSFALATPESLALALRFVQAVPAATSAVKAAHENFADARLAKANAIDTLKHTVSEAAVELAALDSRNIDVEARHHALPDEFRETAMPVDTLNAARDAVQAALRVQTELQHSLGTTSLDLDVLNLRTSIAANLAREVELAQHFVGSVKGAASKVEKADDLVKTAETVAADRQLVVDAAAVPVRIAEATAALAVLDEANAAVHRPRDRATESLQRAHAALNTAQGLHQLPPGMTDQAQTVAAVTTLMRLLDEAQTALEDRSIAISRVLGVENQFKRLRNNDSGASSVAVGNDDDGASVSTRGESDDGEDGDIGDEATVDDAVTALAVSRAALQALLDTHPTELGLEGDGDDTALTEASDRAQKAVTSAESLQVLVEGAQEGANSSVLPKFVEMVAAATAAVNQLNLELHQRTHPTQAQARRRAEQLLEEVRGTYNSVARRVREAQEQAREAGEEPPHSQETEALLEASGKQVERAEFARASLVGPLATPARIVAFLKEVEAAEEAVELVSRAGRVVSDKEEAVMRLMAAERRLLRARELHGGKSDSADDDGAAMLVVADSALAAAKTLATVVNKPDVTAATLESFLNAIAMVESQVDKVERSLHHREAQVLGAFIEDFRKAEARLASLHADVEHLKAGYKRVGTRLPAIDHDLEVASTAVASSETIRSIVKASPEFQSALASVLSVQRGDAVTQAAMPSADVIGLANRFMASLSPAVEATDALTEALGNIGVEQRPSTARVRDVASSIAELRGFASQVEAMAASQRTVEDVAPTSGLVVQSVRVQGAIDNARTAVRLALRLGKSVQAAPSDRDLYTRFMASQRRAAGSVQLASASQSELITQVLDPVVSALAVLGGLRPRLGRVRERLGMVNMEDAVVSKARLAVDAAANAVEHADSLQGAVLASDGTVKQGVLGSVKTAFDPATGKLHDGGDDESKSTRGGEEKGEEGDGNNVSPSKLFVSTVCTSIQRTVEAEEAVAQVHRVARMRQASQLQVVLASLEVARVAARIAQLEERFHRDKARDLACGEAPATLEGVIITSTLLTSAKTRDLQRAKDADEALRRAAASNASNVQLDALADMLMGSVRVARQAVDAVEEALHDTMPQRAADSAVQQARELAMAARHVSATNKLAQLRARFRELERDNAHRGDAIHGGLMLQREFIEAVEDRAVAALEAAEAVTPDPHAPAATRRRTTAGAGGRVPSQLYQGSGGGGAEALGLDPVREAGLSTFVTAVCDASLAVEHVDKTSREVESFVRASYRRSLTDHFHAGMPHWLPPQAGSSVSANTVGLTVLHQSAGSASLAASLVDGPTSYGRMVEEMTLSSLSLDAAAMMPYPRPDRFEEVGPDGAYAAQASRVGDESDRRGGSTATGPSSIPPLGRVRHGMSSVPGVSSPLASSRSRTTSFDSAGGPSGSAGASVSPRRGGDGAGGVEEAAPAPFLPHGLDADVLAHDMVACIAREKVTGLEFRELIGEVQAAEMNSLPLETGLPLKHSIADATSLLRSAKKYRGELAASTAPRLQRAVVESQRAMQSRPDSVLSGSSVQSSTHLSVRSGPAAMAPSPQRRPSRGAMSTASGADIGSLLRGGGSSSGMRLTMSPLGGGHGSPRRGHATFSLSAAFAASSLFEEVVRHAAIAVSQFQVAFDEALDGMDQQPAAANGGGAHGNPNNAGPGGYAPGNLYNTAQSAPQMYGAGDAGQWAAYQQHMVNAIHQTRANFMLRAAAQQYQSILARRYEHEKTMEKAAFMSQRARFEARLQLEKQQQQQQAKAGGVRKPNPPFSPLAQPSRPSGRAPKRPPGSLRNVLQGMSKASEGSPLAARAGPPAMMLAPGFGSAPVWPATRGGF